MRETWFLVNRKGMVIATKVIISGDEIVSGPHESEQEALSNK